MFVNWQSQSFFLILWPKSVPPKESRQPYDIMDLSRSLRNTKYIKAIAHVGALLAASAWGTSFLCTKVLMLPPEQGGGGFTPVEMFVYRFAMAYILLFLFTCRKIFANNFRDELNFLICGVCSGSLYFITENYALNYTTAGNVSLLASVSPIFTTILMAAIFKTKIGIGEAIGSLIAFVGVFCIIFSHGEGFVLKPKGDLLALSASLSWAIYTIVVKNLIPHYSSFFITRKLFFYGVLTAVPLLIAQGAPYHLSVLFDFASPKYALNFLFLVVMCSCAAYLIWNECMNVLGGVTTNNYLYLQPLVTMIAAYIVLGETIYMMGYIGCVLIIGGLILSDKWKPSIRFRGKGG